MGFFGRLVDALLNDRQQITIQVTLPTKLYMAIETITYMDNETSEDEIDRDYIIGIALARYAHRRLAPKTPAPTPLPPTKEPEFTNGRKQSRYQSYQEAERA